ENLLHGVGSRDNQKPVLVPRPEGTLNQAFAELGDFLGWQKVELDVGSRDLLLKAEQLLVAEQALVPQVILVDYDVDVTWANGTLPHRRLGDKRPPALSPAQNTALGEKL